MRKKLIFLICALFVLLICVSCAADQAPKQPEQDPVQTNEPTEVPDDPQEDDLTHVIPLTDEEEELIGLFGEDLQIISEEDYPNTVSELQHHPGSFNGQVFQLEGTLKTTTVNGVETPFVFRMLNNSGEITECGLPLKYLAKDIPDNSWIRVTAIINTEDYDGSVQTVLEVVAVEVPAEAGSAELDWTGSEHSH